MNVFQDGEIPYSSSIWRQHLEETGSAMKRILEPALAKLLGPLEGKKVLDAGCGLGDRIPLLNSLGAKDIVAVDINAESCREALRRFDTVIEARPMDLSQNWDFSDQTFDVILSSNMLMHISASSIRTFAENARRSLRPKGRCVFSTVSRDWAEAQYQGSDHENYYWRTMKGYRLLEHYPPRLFYVETLNRAGFHVDIQVLRILPDDALAERYQRKIGSEIFDVYILEAEDLVLQ